MNKRLIALAAALSVSLAGAVSPAQELYNVVSTYIEQRYGGLSKVNRAELVKEYQQKLDEACAAQNDTCTYETAYSVIEQQVRALGDHHTGFKRPDVFKEHKAAVSDGARLQYGVKLRDITGGYQVVTEVVPGSTAFEAGVQRGDVLTAIDGQPYSFEALRASRTKGAPIQLDVKRGDQTFQVTVQARESSTRDLPRITYLNDVAVLRIPTFLSAGGIAQKVHDLVHEAQGRGAQGIIVDLRDNGGGDLRECDASTSAFVPSFTRIAKTARGDSATIVARGGFREGIGTHQMVRNPALWEGPLAVLVTKGSASCSEFFASEIQYAKRGVVIGEATVGVGNTATQYFPLPGEAAIQLTTVHYAKPDGKPYAERVTPDIQATEDFDQLARGQDVMLQRGVEAVRTRVANAGTTER